MTVTESNIETSPFSFTTELYLALLEIDARYDAPPEHFNVSRAMDPLYSIQDVIDTYIGPATRLREITPYMEIMVKIQEERATTEEFDSLLPFSRSLREQLLTTDTINHVLILDIMDFHRNLSILGMKFYQLGYLPEQAINTVSNILEQINSFSVIGVSGHNEGDTQLVELLNKRANLLMQVIESGDSNQGLSMMAHPIGSITHEQSQILKDLGYYSEVDSLIAEALYAEPSIANYL
ncbi:TPA: hypothetical protein EYP66_21505 [Candidatus Poribacteria bacterium]|nr:hypothetical protein [Candidatus Poribacteria bacterium]